MLGLNDTSTLVGHFVSSPREREKRYRRDSRGDENEGQGRKRTRMKVTTAHICEGTCSDVLILKTCLYNFDPLKPHFYIVKLGFTGVYIIFLISAQKHRLWVL